MKNVVMDGVETGKVGKLEKCKIDEEMWSQSEERLCKSIIKGLARRKREIHAMLADVEEEQEQDVICFDDITGKELPCTFLKGGARPGDPSADLMCSAAISTAHRKARCRLGGVGQGLARLKPPLREWAKSCISLLSATAARATLNTQSPQASVSLLQLEQHEMVRST